MSVKLLTVHHLEIVSLKGGCTGSCESTLVKMPHCWKSHATAQLLFTLKTRHFSFFKGIVPLWSRQIPYTMMKFACFERTVEALYKYVVPKPRAECNKSEQLLVTFVAGYIGKLYNIRAQFQGS